MKREWSGTGLVMIVVVLLVVVVAGCARYKETEVRQAAITAPSAPGEVKKAAPAPANAEKSPGEVEKQRLVQEKLLAEVRVLETRNIHFEFDKYDLRPDARAILDELGAWLIANRNFNVIVEGHCDDRGTAEYNLALGERRANAARDYLVTLGAGAGRIDMISYGEERPLDRRSNEEAWAKNRRCQFKIQAR